MAGPLDELVKRILRRIDVFKTDHGLEEVEVTVELLDGSLHRLRTLSADPGFGFVSFRPHGARTSRRSSSSRSARSGRSGSRRPGSSRRSASSGS